MARYKYSEVKIGVFVLGALLIILLTVFYTKGFILGKDYVKMSAFFPSVSGLSIGDPVTVRGVQQGQVESIKLKDDSVLVDFTLHKNVNIYENYKIEIAVLEIMGGKQLYIDPGSNSAQEIHDIPLRGTTGATITDLFRSFDGITNDIEILLEGFQKNSETMNEVLINLNDIVGDPRFKNDMRNTVTNFALASRNLNSLVLENRANFNNLTNKFGKTIDNVNTVFDETTPEFKKTFVEIQILTNRIDSLITNLNSVVLDIKNPDLGVGKFIYDDEFYDNLNKTLIEVEKLMKKIRQDGVKINLF